MQWHDGEWGVGGWVAMFLVMVLFWLGILASVVWAFRYDRRRPTPAAPYPDGSARRILDERFARGEIDENEYRQRRSALTSQ